MTVTVPLAHCVSTTRLQKLVIAPYLIATHLMAGDIFTKVLDAEKFHRFRNYLLNTKGMVQTVLTDTAGRVAVLRGRAARWWVKCVDAVTGDSK